MIIEVPVTSHADRHMQFEGQVLVITKHALERFVLRWPVYEVEALENPLGRLKKLVTFSRPVHINQSIKLIRSGNNEGDAHYYSYRHWRFVIVTKGDRRVLVTVEPNDPTT